MSDLPETLFKNVLFYPLKDDAIAPLVVLQAQIFPAESSQWIYGLSRDPTFGYERDKGPY